jgi:hypothetical protein
MSGDSFDIAWTATGAAAGNDVCISISNTNTDEKHGKYDGTFRTKVSTGQVTAKFGKKLPIGSYKVRLSVRKKGQERPPCSPDGKVGDDVVIQHVGPPQPVCGNEILEEGEACDHSGFACLIAPPDVPGIPKQDVSRVTSGKWYKSGGSCESNCTKLIPGSRLVREIVHDDVTEADFCDRSKGPHASFCDVENLFYDRPEGNPYSTGFRQVPCSATVKCNDTSGNQSNCAGGKP